MASAVRIVACNTRERVDAAIDDHDWPDCYCRGPRQIRAPTVLCVELGPIEVRLGPARQPHPEPSPRASLLRSLAVNDEGDRWRDAVTLCEVALIDREADEPAGIDKCEGLAGRNVAEGRDKW